MSYRPMLGDVCYFEFDDGSHISKRTHPEPAVVSLWHAVAEFPDGGMDWDWFAELDIAIHWLRSRGLARRLIQTGRYDGTAWTYSATEDAPSPV
jgi:hypothetical protein